MSRITISLMLVLGISSVQAQDVEPQELKRKPSLGFNFGLNYSLLNNGDAKDELQIENAPGFRLGLVSDYPISKRFSIAPKAELSFNYANVTQNGIRYRADKYTLEGMVHFKYDMGYKGKYKSYCYIGPNFRTPLHKAGEFTDLNSRSTVAIDFGFGVDMQFKNFTMSPELRFSAGIMDIRKEPQGKMLRGSNASLILNFTSK